MKKILFSLFLTFLCLGSFGQNSMLSTLYKNWYQYRTYQENGSGVKAMNSKIKLMQGTALYSAYIGGHTQGRLGIMDSCLTAFNALYGKTHSAPTFTATSVSFLDVDSLAINGVIVDDYYSKDSIMSWITAAELDTTEVIDLIERYSIDSTFLNEHLVTLWDSLSINSAMEDTILAWIADSVISNDSLIALIQAYSIQTDSVLIHLGNFWDTLSYPTEAEVAGMIKDSISGLVAGATDSTYYQITAGDIVLNTAISPSGVSKITSNNTVTSFQYSLSEKYMTINTLAGYIFGVTPTTYLVLKFYDAPTVTAPNIIPYSTDANTGYSWVSADKLGLVAGGVSTLTSEYSTPLATSITKVTDSLYVSKGIETIRLHGDSIKMGTGEYLQRLAGYDAAPTDSSIFALTPSGVNFLYPLSSIVEAIEDSSEVAESATKQVKVYNSTGAYFDYYNLAPDTTYTITDSTVSVDVTNTRGVFVSDSEGCAIFGFANGVEGQEIWITNTTTNNLILKNNSTGTQKIQNGGDVTITGYGGATLTYNGTSWFIIGKNE